MVLIFCFGVGCSVSAQADSVAEEKATVSCMMWLQSLDEGDYGQTWENSASYLKGMIQKEDWETLIQGAREPLGKALSRELLSKQYTTTLPGAPDGEYVVIQFVTSFEKKGYAVETITPMLDQDGMWRVAGYFIR